MRPFVLGATGETGQAIVGEALARDHQVTAIVRSQTKAVCLLPGAALIEGDARDPAALARALDGCKAVLSALGTRKISIFKPVTMMSEATRTLLDLMVKQEVSRLVCITGLGAGDSAGDGGFVYDRLIKPILLRTMYNDKDRQDAIIKASRVQWVIVRPIVLTDKSVTGPIRAITDLTGSTVDRFLEPTSRFLWLPRPPELTGCAKHR